MGQPELFESIRQFLASKKVDSGLARNSTDSYALDLEQFAEFIRTNASSKAPIFVRDLTPEHLEAFLAEKKSEGLKPASLARKTSALRQFFKFCLLELGLELNPAENLRANVTARNLPKALSGEKIAALLAAVETGLPYERQKKGDSLRARDRAMITLLYATGLRVSELLNLRARDVDFDLNFVRVMGKGSKERLVPFVEAARDRLVHYLEKHRVPLLLSSLESDRTSEASQISESLPLFLTANGEGMTRQGFWKFLKNLGQQAGLSEDLSPHWIRHSFATHLLEAGLGLRTLQTLLGHSDVSTTQIYTEMNPGHLKEIHAKFHPRGGKD